jgi:hypothetical protein
MKYVKKPIVVEAFHFGHEIQPKWFNDCNAAYIPDEEGKNRYITIFTLEGIMKAYPGDMIIKGIKGEIYPCKKDIFDATYDLIEEPQGGHSHVPCSDSE